MSRFSTETQNFACSRRELLGKLFATAVATAASKRSVESSIFKSYPLPEFVIGDFVAQDWEGEFGEKEVEYGEILGLHWVPEAYSCYPANTWLYFIKWTHSTCGSDFCYPYYDGKPTVASELRLVS